MRRARPLATLAALSIMAGATTALSTTAVASTLRAAAAASPLVTHPTSWPPAPLDERLQPWLGRQLDKGGDAPIRVMVSGETLKAADEAARRAGLRVQQSWDRLGIIVAVGTPAQVRAVVPMPGVRNVSGDQPLEHALDTAHQATRSDQALVQLRAPDGRRLDGAGVSIAVIDSGIDGTHPFFTRNGKSKVVRNLENACTAASAFTPVSSDTCFKQEPTNDTDTNSGGGHGTHVAGIAAGYEVTTTLPAGEKLRGAAPEAKLVGLSVGAVIGLVNATAAMNWVVEHQRKPCASKDEQAGDLDPACPPIRVTNHSYGPIAGPDDDLAYDEGHPAVTAQRVLISQGVTVVWAAGNEGGDGTKAKTNPPAMDPTPGVLMVASYNDAASGLSDNELSAFSSRGKKGSFGTYPDVSAPGDSITSSCRPTLPVCQGFPSYDAGNYQTISGTSMATPYIAGVVAQLAQADSGAAPGQVEHLLEDNAHRFTAGGSYEPDPRNAASPTSFDKGHGLVDVRATLTAALARLVSPTPSMSASATATATATSTPSPTSTASPTPTSSSTSTAPPTPTETATAGPTSATTETATPTPTESATSAESTSSAPPNSEAGSPDNGTTGGGGDASSDGTAEASPTSASSRSSASDSPSRSVTPSSTAASEASQSVTAARAEEACAPPLQVRVNTPVIAATGFASVTILGARPGQLVDLQGYGQDRFLSRSFANDDTPQDRSALADDNGTVTFNDLRLASNTRLRAQERGCPPGDSASVHVRTQLTLAVTKLGPRSYRVSGKAIPAREGGLIVTLYRITGAACAAGVEPSRCPGERPLGQVRANAATGHYALPVTFAAAAVNSRVSLVLKTGQDGQNAPGRSNVRSLLILS